MPVDRTWLAGLPDPQPEQSEDWETAIDMNFLDFTRFGGGDLDMEDALSVQDHDMFPMVAGVESLPARISPMQLMTVDPLMATRDSDIHDVTPPTQGLPSGPSDYTQNSYLDSDTQSNVSSGVTGSSSDRSRKGKGAETPRAPIPLLCHICEGTPSFSDVSHLLTHCSSRAHTKRHFDMRARALTEGTAAAILRTYDNWYDENQIGPMINRRLIEKDAKDRARKIETEKRKLAQPPPKKRKTEANALFIKKEPKNAGGESSRLPPALPIEPALNLHHLEALPFHPSANSDSAAGSSHSNLPSASHKQPDAMVDHEFEDLPIPGLQSPNGSIFAPSEAGFEYGYVDEESDERKPALKGKFWPGMDIFDAASEQDRRKRNQRKDASVLRKMQRSSASIQTTMMVLDTNLERGDDRDVYDDPSCDESTPAKKPTSAGKRKITPKKFGRTKGKSSVRIKSEPRTPRAARRSSTTALQTSVPRRATRGSAARAQVEIARLAQSELEDRFEDVIESDDEARQERLTNHGSVSSHDRDSSARPSTAGISSDGNASVSTNDVFQDADAASAAAMNHGLDAQGHARFPRRNRMPLQALSRNGNSIASPNLSSPTPSSKPVIHSFAGKENNNIFKQGMIVPHPSVPSQTMGSHGMMYPNMGMQGMPRSLWPSNMNQNPYGFAYPSAFPEPMLFGPGVGAHQNSSMMQPQMNGMFHDDLQHDMFRTHPTIDGQVWQTTGNDLSGNPNAQGLGILNTSWLGNGSSGAGYDDDHQGDHFQDN